jgi:F-type H+-transporting ATPase subunit b
LVIYSITQFAQQAPPKSGIGAFNLNVKTFIFQLITFTLVLLVFRKWVVPKLVATMDQRQKTLEQSLEQAKQTEAALAKAQTQADEILANTRLKADQALAEARKAASEIIAQAETAASKRAALIIEEAEERLGHERQRLYTELKQELAGLVAAATEKVLRKKVNEREDRALIEQSLKDIG